MRLRSRGLFLADGLCGAQQNATPATTEGDFVVHNFQFRSGESLPDVRLHYTTLGKPAKDAQGRTTNAVLILHGTGGSGHQFLAPYFAGELFGPGQLLDASRYFLILVGRRRAWEILEAERRAARAFPAIRLRRHGGCALQAAHRRAGRESFAAGPRHVDGLHALVGVGRDVSRFYGCADAAWRACRCRLPGAIASGARW